MYVYMYVCMYKYTDINDFNKYREYISSIISAPYDSL